MVRLRTKELLLVATALVGAAAVGTPAQAQDASALQAIQRQIQELQSQLRALQRQAAQRDAALRRAQADAAEARAAAQRAAQATAVPPAAPFAPAVPTAGVPVTTGTPAYASLRPGEEPVVLVHPVDSNGQVVANAPTGKFRVGNMTITLGGYLDFVGLYRSKNLTSGSGTPFKSVPFGNSPNYYADEFRATAQQTRLALLVQAPVSQSEQLLGYVESDFNGAATTSNSVQSNSYTPRLRQAFGEYDNSALGLHVVAGQAWSLATADIPGGGLIPRNESIPMVIDTNYLPGFVYTRSPQVRVVKDFGKLFHVGFSLEEPQETYSVSGATTTTASSTASGSAALPAASNQSVGSTAYYNNVGGSFLNSTTTYSYDVAPDMILKGTADPGFGHYEVFGLGRFFKSEAGAATKPASVSDKTVFGGGVGGAFTIPIVPHFVDFTGDVLGGYGVARYGAASLTDATFQANGEPAPLPEVIGYLGVVGHVTKALDLYAYTGAEVLGRSAYRSGSGSTATLVGYGQSTVNTSGCYTLAGTCSAQVHSVWNVSLGEWWKVLHGSWGTVQAGLEYSYTRVDAFRGAAGKGVSSSPQTSDNIVMLDLRYSPFN